MAALDYVTGQEIVFSCAYLVPISMTAWWFQRRWVIIMSIASAITAFIVDELDGYDYSHHIIQYWNALTCFVICIVAGLLISHLRRTLIEKQRVNANLRKALDELEASTAQVRKLQGDLQTICAWTKRIKVGEEWMTPEEFLRTQLHLNLSHGVSPQAFRGLEQELSNTA
jgi:hypothetical protein